MPSNRSCVKPFWIVAAMCMLIFSVAYNSTAIMNSLVVMGYSLHLTFNQQQWAANVYMLVAASLIILSGQFADNYGKRRLLIIGMGIFAVSCLMVGLAYNATSLIIGRALQGLGAALLTPGSMAIIKTCVEEKYLTASLSAWSGAIGLGFAFGPSLGGIVTEFISWRMTFFVTIIFIAIAGIIFLLTSPREDTRHPQKIDLLGLCLLIPSLSLLAVGLMQSKIVGLGNFWIIGALLASVALFTLFIVVEAHTKEPMINFALFKKAEFIVCMLVLGMNSVGITSSLYFMNIYFQNIALLNYSPFWAGIALLPASIAMFVMSFFAARLVFYLGFRRVLMISFLLRAISFVLIGMTASLNHYIWIMVPLSVIGASFGIGYSVPPSLALQLFPNQYAGKVSGILNTVNYLCSVLAIAVGGLVYALGQQDALRYLMDQRILNADTLNTLTNNLYLNSLSAVLAVFPAHMHNAIIHALQYLGSHPFMLVMFFDAVIAITAVLLAKYFIPHRLVHPPNAAS